MFSHLINIQAIQAKNESWDLQLDQSRSEAHSTLLTLSLDYLDP